MSKSKKVAPTIKKVEIPTNKGATNLIEVIKAHDGLVVGQSFEPNRNTALKMISLGFWKWKE